MELRLAWAEVRQGASCRGALVEAAGSKADISQEVPEHSASEVPEQAV